MEEYTIYCTKEQTKKAFELGAPLITISEPLYNHPFCWRDWTKVKVQGNNRSARIPTAEQMIGWLRKEKGLYVEPYLNGECRYSFSPIVSTKEDGEIIRCEAEDSPEEATLAGIDAALDYLANNSKKEE